MAIYQSGGLDEAQATTLTTKRSRSQRSDVFAKADLCAFQLGTTGALADTILLKDHVIVFGGNTSDTYGELIHSDGNLDESKWVGRCYPAWIGLVILEIQERLYSFLVACCKGILHELTEAELAGSANLVQPEPPSLLSIENGPPSLAVIAAEAPYQVPAGLDLQPLKLITSAKLSDAEDRLCALREDPGYFTDTLWEYSEHDERCISRRASNLRADPRKNPEFWLPALQDIVAESQWRLTAWAAICDLVGKLQDLEKKYELDMKRVTNIPEEVLHGFHELLYHLGRYTKDLLHVWRTRFASSPSMRCFFHDTNELTMPSSERSRLTVCNRDFVKSVGHQKLDRIIGALYQDHCVVYLGVDLLLDELERLLEHDAQAKGLISSCVSGYVSDLSISSQASHQIGTFLLHVAQSESQKLSLETMQSADDQHVQAWKALFQISLGGRITSLGNPTDGKFKYPVDKRATRENITVIRQDEANLDNRTRPA